MIKVRLSTKLFLFMVFFLLPALVLSQCTCDEAASVFSQCSCGKKDEDHDKTKALEYKGAAIASILIGSAIGFTIPMSGKRIRALSPEKDIFFILKAFAAGVILATGFIHVLPDAFDNLTSPCLNEHPWGDFPFTGFVAMCTSMGTLMIDAFVTMYFKKIYFRNDQVQTADEERTAGHNGHLHLHTHATHGHSHGAVSSKSSEEDLRHRVISQVLELGIIVHSVVIGISLGASENPKTIKPLVAALTFHQFFEGLGLSSCIAQAKFKNPSIVIMAVFFSLTTPVGIVIGIGITNGYNEYSPKALIVEGILNAASSGILIYMALVDLLVVDLMHPKMQSNGRLQMGANVSLLLGAGFMSLLAKWA